MIKKDSAKTNFIYSLVYQFAIAIIPLIVSPYLSRCLGPEGVGEYSYSYSISHYFAIFILLGLANYGSRSIASVRDDPEKLKKIFWEIYYLQLILGFVFNTLYIAFLFIAYGGTNIIANLMILYVLSVAFDITWFFYGIEKFKFTVLRSLIIKIINALCIFFFVILMKSNFSLCI